MLDAKLEQQNDQLLLRLAGSLDEEADLDAIFDKVNNAVVVNLEGINRLNSIGVHKWITAIAVLSKRVKVQVENCSYPFALQASYVANMFGEATVSSTLAPYFCPACGYNGMVMVERNDVKDGSPPEKACPTCSKGMQFDELDTYLSFILDRTS